MHTRTALGIIKIYVCVATAIAAYMALASHGLYGGAVLLLYVLAPVFGMGLADAIINDLLPDGYEATFVTHTKYLVFVGLSGVNVSLLYPELLGLNYGYETVMHGFNAAAAAGVAVLDLRERQRQAYAEEPARCEPAAQDP